MTRITAIILTFNEEKHIQRCIQSLTGTVDEIIVVDSYSTDNTIQLSSELGAQVYQNPFVNQAVQFNWALANCPITSQWILRIDADEYIDNRQNIDLRNYLANQAKDINGIIIRRKIVFLGKPLLYGGWYPKWNLRIFRTGKGKCEERWMDEHIVVTEGSVTNLKLDFVDENLNDLTWWVQKHNNYATREAIDYFLQMEEINSSDGVQPRMLGSEAERKRWLKRKYQNFPLFIRPFLNFMYRYLLKLGILDRVEGLIWHILQSFWYRFLVDAKIYTLKKKFNYNNAVIIEHIKAKYNVNR